MLWILLRIIDGTWVAARRSMRKKTTHKSTGTALTTTQLGTVRGGKDQLPHWATELSDQIAADTALAEGTPTIGGYPDYNPVHKAVGTE